MENDRLAGVSRATILRRSVFVLNTQPSPWQHVHALPPGRKQAWKLGKKTFLNTRLTGRREVGDCWGPSRFLGWKMSPREPPARDVKRGAAGVCQGDTVRKGSEEEAVTPFPVHGGPASEDRQQLHLPQGRIRRKAFSAIAFFKKIVLFF